MPYAVAATVAGFVCLFLLSCLPSNCFFEIGHVVIPINHSSIPFQLSHTPQCHSHLPSLKHSTRSIAKGEHAVKERKENGEKMHYSIALQPLDSILYMDWRAHAACSAALRQFEHNLSIHSGT